MTDKKSIETLAKKKKYQRILAIRIENIKKIEAASLEFGHGNLIEITGKNASGKSTFMDSFMYGLRGFAKKNTTKQTTQAPRPPRVIRDGAERGSILIELDDYLVKRTFTKRADGYEDTDLTVKDRAGSTLAREQETLDEFVSKIGIDPFAFMRMLPEDQRAALQEIVHVDTSAVDAAYDEAYAERTETKSRRDFAREALTRLEAPLPDLPPKPIDLAKLEEELATAQAHNDAVDASAVLVKQWQDHAQQADTGAQIARTKIEGFEREILRLRKQIEEEEHAEELAKQEAASLRERAGKLAIQERRDMAKLLEDLKNARATNTQIRLRDEYRAKEAEVNKYENEHNHLNELVKKLLQDKKDLLAGAKFPLEGLAIDNGYVSYNGIPLVQASTAEQLRVSVSIGMAADPRLRFFTIKEGSLLDEESLDILHRMAEEHDFLILVECVRPDTESGIVLEAGKIVKVNPPRKLKTTKNRK